MSAAPRPAPTVEEVVDALDRRLESEVGGNEIRLQRKYGLDALMPVYLEALPKLAADITDAAKRVQEQLKEGVSRRAQARIQPKLDELKKVHDALKADLAKRYAL